MKKEEYLDKLKNCLKNHISKNEIEEILTDYEEYFEDGKRQNKSDTEISAKLGNPEIIANQLIEEFGENKKINKNKDKKDNTKLDIVVNDFKKKFSNIKKFPTLKKENRILEIFSSFIKYIFNLVKSFCFLIIHIFLFIFSGIILALDIGFLITSICLLILAFATMVIFPIYFFTLALLVSSLFISLGTIILLYLIIHFTNMFNYLKKFYFIKGV